MLALLLGTPLLAGCSGVGQDMFSSDVFSKDADWFTKPQRVFIRNVSIESPPLTPDKPVGPQDMITADGMCPGMAPAANALSNGADGVPQPMGSGTVALGHTECDVARGNGAPDSVNLSSGPGGQRVAVLTYNRGGRPGIYTFTAGRLSSVEANPNVAPEPKVARTKAKPKKKKPATPAAT